MILLAITSARAGCDARSLMELASAADQAFERMDADGFARTATGIDETLACGQEVLTPIQVVAYHRTKALTAFFDGDDAQTILAFQSALATMPGYSLPTDIAPEGHPLRQSFEQAKLFGPGEPVELAEPASGWLMIDGTRTRSAPSGRPFVFQRIDADGAVLVTQYVPVGAPIPAYPVQLAEAPDPVPPGPKPPTPRRTNNALLGTGLAMAAIAGGAYGTAFYTRSQYDDAVLAGDESGIRSSYTATNGLVGGSIGLAALGATFVVVGVF
jgi:hypothetical protein